MRRTGSGNLGTKRSSPTHSPRELTSGVTTRLPASCSTHAVPPLLRFSSSFPLSLTRSPRVDRVPLSLTHVRLVVASHPHVYNLSCFDERALRSFSCGIRRSFVLFPV